MMELMQWIVGVDEAGRGALAGPVSVGAVLYPSDFDWQELYALVTSRGKVRLRDSKQLSAQQRELLFERIVAHGRLKHAAAFVDAAAIDEIGIVNAAHEATAEAIRALGVSPERVFVQLDAGLRAPSQWRQEAYVRGDATYPAIAFASIIAKVSRDRLMQDLADEYPGYGFEGHKGYGTVAHTSAIHQRGMSVIHRRTFVHLQR